MADETDWPRVSEAARLPEAGYCSSYQHGDFVAAEFSRKGVEVVSQAVLAEDLLGNSVYGITHKRRI